jgi:amidase
MADPLARLDATAQAELVRRGEVAPIELVDAAIARIEKLDPELNAVVSRLYEKARAQAQQYQRAFSAAGRDELEIGPFCGVPFLLKDLVCHSAGDPFHAGMRLLKSLGWTERADTHLAAKLRAAGLVFLGKTNVPELGPMTTTEPVAYGPSRNPWNPAHSTGGSSGGSAAAVASGMVPAAHANDGGGSIRIPASECGLVGLKPARGRTSLGPDIGDAWGGLTIEHVLTRSVRDTAALLDAVSGPMPGDPYTAPPPARPFAAEVGEDPGRLRVGLLTSASERGIEVHPDCIAAAQETARLLESLGHAVEEASPPRFHDEACARAMATVVQVGTARDLEEWSARTGRIIGEGDVEPATWALAEGGWQAAGTEYLAAIQTLQAYTRAVARFWAEDGFDLLLSPTLAEPPPPLGSFASTPEDPLAGFRRSAAFVCFTAPFNVTGQPAVSLPLHWNAQGLPVGVQLAAAYAREDLLIRVAAQLEEARPWHDRWPPLSA